MRYIKTFFKMKREKEKIVMLTAYDYISAKCAEEAGVDLILVGDSLGMVVLGYESTLHVRLEDILYHTKAVKRGAPKTFIVADMPFMSFHLDINETKRNAAKLIVEGNASAVKIEGGSSSRIKVIAGIADCEIPVVAHLGLTPQSIKSLGKYSVQGKAQSDYEKILLQAREVEKAGAFMLVLEAVPETLAKEISESLDIPVIGIGAGKYTDGQVLVLHDILNLTDFKPKLAKVYGDCKKIFLDSMKSYTDEVKNGKFPTENNIYL